MHEYVRVRNEIMGDWLGERTGREQQRALLGERDYIYIYIYKGPASDLTLEVFNQARVFGKRRLQRAAPPTQSVNSSSAVLLSSLIQKSMSLKCDPASEPLHKWSTLRQHGLLNESPSSGSKQLRFSPFCEKIRAGNAIFA